MRSNATDTNRRRIRAQLHQPSEARSHSHGGGLVARPVLRAYEQIANQIRQLVENGSLSQDARLPNEIALAREFGVSRATVREALRLLTARNLLRTEKGREGGSFIRLPTVADLQESLSSHYNLLSRDSISVEEFFEVRLLLEVPAARMAAERAAAEQIELLRATVPYEPLRVSAMNHRRNAEFHSVLLGGCGNRLLCLAAEPVLQVLQKSIAHEYVTQEFRQSIKEQHHRITEAIANRDPDGAAREMESHLRFLRPAYDLIPKFSPTGD